MKDRREPAVPSLDSVRPQLEKELRDKKALDLALQKANGLLAELKKSKDLADLARRHQLKTEETGWFQRSALQLPRVGQLLELKRGGIAVSSYQPVPDQVYTQNDAVYLFAFKESRPADAAAFEREKTRLKEQAETQKKQEVVKKFIESLKARAQININPGFLDTI